MVTGRSRPAIAALACLAICMIAAASAMADANIRVTSMEGSFDDGGFVVLRGQGFETKSPAQPFLWDDFEGGTAGAGIGSPVFGRYTRADNAAYSTAGAYNGSLCSYSLVSESTPNGVAGLVANWIPAETRGAFASMKLRLVSASGSLSVHGGKLFRLNTSDPDPTHGYPNFCLSLQRNSFGVESVVNLGLGWGEANRQFAVGSINNPEWNNRWQSTAIWDLIGDQDVPNGIAGREWNGNIVEARNVVTLSSLGGTDMGVRSAYFCGYLERQGYDIACYLDDVYADTTMARVVVSDPSGGNMEMQIPYAWSGDEIQIQVNPGLYPSGTELSLVVYDRFNNPSPPFPVTVGENTVDPDLGPPGPPGRPTRE